MVEEVFRHAPRTLWKTLTTGELIRRWLMEPTYAGAAQPWDHLDPALPAFAKMPPA